MLKTETIIIRSLNDGLLDYKVLSETYVVEI